MHFKGCKKVSSQKNWQQSKGPFNNIVLGFKILFLEYIFGNNQVSQRIMFEEEDTGEKDYLEIRKLEN